MEANTLSKHLQPILGPRDVFIFSRRLSVTILW